MVWLLCRLVPAVHVHRPGCGFSQKRGVGQFCPLGIYLETSGREGEGPVQSPWGQCAQSELETAKRPLG